METRKCLKCGAVRPLVEFHLHHDKQGKITRRNVCKDCENARKRAHYHNEEPVLLKHRQAEGDPSKFQPDIADLITAYLNLIHWRPENLGTVSLEKYNKHFNLQASKEDFQSIVEAAEARLEEWGYFNPQAATLDPRGTYLVIGDTFGTHTPDGVFDLLKLVVDRERVKAVVIIGHNIDDENLISNRIADFGEVPVVIVSPKDELKYVYAQRDYGYTVVQDHVSVGDIVIRNQEHITPYVKTAISQLDPMLFPGKMIVNCTRQELSVRSSPNIQESPNFIASPGALSDPHVVTIINRLIFANGDRVMTRPTNKDSYHKHRKNETDKTLWERGFILIHKCKVTQRRIFCDNGEYRTVIAGKVFDHKGNQHQASKTLILSDIHAPYHHEGTVLHVLAANNDSDKIYFNGDIIDCRSFNPHNQYEAAHADFLEELHTIKELMTTLSDEKKWAMGFSRALKIMFLLGNHEDFIRRFSEKYPQFANLFKTLIVDTLEIAGRVALEDHRDWVQIGLNTILHHGSADIFGVSGNNLEKTARSFQQQAIIGHTHSPAIRFGVYRTGCLCRLDQGYNNSYVTNWQKGYAVMYTDDKYDYVELVNL